MAFRIRQISFERGWATSRSVPVDFISILKCPPPPISQVNFRGWSKLTCTTGGGGHFHDETKSTGAELKGKNLLPEIVDLAQFLVVGEAHLLREVPKGTQLVS